MAASGVLPPPQRAARQTYIGKRNYDSSSIAIRDRTRVRILPPSPDHGRQYILWNSISVSSYTVDHWNIKYCTRIYTLQVRYTVYPVPTYTIVIARSKKRNKRRRLSTKFKNNKYYYAFVHILSLYNTILLRTPPNRYVCRNSIKSHIIAVLEDIAI